MGFGMGDQGTAEAGRGARLRQSLIVVAALAAVAGISLLDRWVGSAASLPVLSVFPVMAVAWWALSEQAVVVAVAAVAAALLTDPTAEVWTAVTLGVVFLAAAALPGRMREAMASQAEAAATDPLTGALNRRSFEEAAERERLRAERRLEPISLAYLDLDGFKEVNDRHGHQQGDRVLEELAERILESIRGTDLFCRIGGDEFVLLLPDTDAREAAAVLQRARSAMAPTGAPVTASIGIATFRIVPTTVGAMVDAADELMYRAKKEGKNRIVGSVIGGPWLRWDGDERDPAADTVTVDVEIVLDDGGPALRSA